VSSALAGLLHVSEVRAVVARLERLLAKPRFPEPGAGRRHVPWPPW